MKPTLCRGFEAQLELRPDRWLGRGRERSPLPPPRNDSHIPKAIPDYTRAIGAGVIPKAVFDAANILLLPGLRWRRARGLARLS
jgi:hypothetical protein